MDVRHKARVALAILFCCFYNYSDAIQCYSCTGAGPNEVEANIRCLETAYLENCDDFYQYYSEVEETDAGDDDYYDDEYYYYDDEDEEEEDGEEEDGDDDREEKVVKSNSVKAPSEKSRRPPSNSRERSRGGRTEERERGRRIRRASPRFRGGGGGGGGDEYPPDYPQGRGGGGGGGGGKEGAIRKTPANDSDYGKDEFDYAAFEDEQYDYGNDFRFKAPPDGEKKKTDNEAEKEDRKRKSGRKSKLTQRDDDEDYADEEEEDEEEDDEDEEEEEEEDEVLERSKVSLPKDPEHWCYSQTTKNAWESYKVEKGCKKIKYCKEHMENFPDWGLPWNFCCDKSRCNAKLVKDKPQRIYGMGCRRTDDCIQGHTNRPVCPGMFKSCPRISSTLIKMECQIKAHRAGPGPKNTATYFDKFREKKCYCSKGFYPRGPICTSSAAVVRMSLATSLYVIVSVLLH